MDYFAGVCSENLDSDGLMMRHADQGIRYDASNPLNWPRDRLILSQGTMSSRRFVIARIGIYDPTQVLLTQCDALGMIVVTLGYIDPIYDLSGAPATTKPARVRSRPIVAAKFLWQRAATVAAWIKAPAEGVNISPDARKAALDNARCSCRSRRAPSCIEARPAAIGDIYTAKLAA
jgi:hypothetical protein